MFSGDGAIIDLVNYTVVVPLLFGLFWGAPLLAKEFEDGTHNLAWTQGVTRRRWFRTNVAWALLRRRLLGGCPYGARQLVAIARVIFSTQFQGFDIQGIVPVAYALFAVALGIAVGAFVPRVPPAIAATLGVFVALRVAIGVYLRPHYVAAVTKLFPLAGGRSSLPRGAWVLSQGTAGPHGQSFGQSFSTRDIPAVCRVPAFSFDRGSVLPCLTSHGFHQMITFQPANRFWVFQGIESAIFIVLAVVMIALAYRKVISRDA